MVKFVKSFALWVLFITSPLMAQVYTVGMILENPPIEYMKDGKPAGFDVELLNAVAKEVGFEYEIKNMKFSELFDSINSGKIDFAISFISITKDREAKFDFTQPYFFSPAVFLKLAGNEEIKKVEDLKGKTIAVPKKDTTLHKIAMGIEGAKIIITDENLVDALIAVKTKKADALIVESVNIPMALYSKTMGFNKEDSAKIEQYKEINLESMASIKTAGVGMMFKKGTNSELISKINEAITKLKTNGELQNLIAHHIIGY